MWKLVAALLSLAAGPPLVACDREPGAPDAQAAVSAAERVVATVDGVPIRAVDVARRASAGQISARAAAEELIEQELLAAEAARRGYRAAGDAQLAVRRLAVEALLRDVVEAPHVPSRVEGASEAYHAQRDRFHSPARRAARHLLVASPERSEPAVDAAARQLASEILAELRSHPDPLSAMQGYRGDRGGLRVVVEDIPPLSRQAELVQPFLDAVWGAPEVGLLDRVTRTTFGYHLIYVSALLPAEETPFEEVEADLRRELSVERRRLALEGLLSSLREATKVEWVRDTVPELPNAAGPNGTR